MLLRPPPATAIGIGEAVRLVHSSRSILNPFRAFGELDSPRWVGPNLGATGFQPFPTIFCRGRANLIAGYPQKSQLHDLFLRLCWLHEMAAVPSFGHGCGSGGRPVVAQFR
jgi:hypothetical protein